MTKDSPKTKPEQSRKPAASEQDLIELEIKIKDKVIYAARKLCKANTGSECTFINPNVELQRPKTENHLFIEHTAILKQVVKLNYPPIETYTFLLKDGKIQRVEITNPFSD